MQARAESLALTTLLEKKKKHDGTFVGSVCVITFVCNLCGVPSAVKRALVVGQKHVSFVPLWVRRLLGLDCLQQLAQE